MYASLFVSVRVLTEVKSIRSSWREVIDSYEPPKVDSRTRARVIQETTAYFVRGLDLDQMMLTT